jgi:hypothetical protein
MISLAFLSDLSDPGGWLFFAGCALLTFLMVRLSYRRFGKRRPRGGSGPYLERVPRPTDAWDGAQRDAFSRIERQKVELFDLSREANGRLDSKIVVLEQLIATSNRQIHRLEQLLEKLEHRQDQV